MSNMEQLQDIVRNGKLNEVVDAVNVVLEEGVAPLDVLNEGLVEPINSLGEQFRLGEIFVPELLMASKTMKKGVEVVKPLIMSSDVKNAGRILFCTVAGDMHDIGKNLVVLLLESAGFEVEDLGMDIEADEIVEAIEDAIDDEEPFQILGMSAMLTTTMYAMQETIEAIEEAGLRDEIKIMVGGAPVNQTFADKIGADGYSSNAPLAVELAKRLMAEA